MLYLCWLPKSFGIGGIIRALQVKPIVILCCWPICFGAVGFKVHIFWEGHKILRNLHRRFYHYIGQIYIGDFAKICGLLRIYELYFGLNARLETQILNEVYSGPLLLMSRVKDKCNLNSVGAIFRLFPRESKGSCKKSLLISVAFFDMHLRQGLGLRGFCFWKKTWTQFKTAYLRGPHFNCNRC